MLEPENDSIITNVELKAQGSKSPCASSFPMPESNISLETILIERLRRSDPMTFRDFMQEALYDPARGYYNTERSKIGPAGDYYTSSNTHSAFGALLARALIEMWDSFFSHEALTLIEIGAGTGQLAFDVLTAIETRYPTHFNPLRYVIVETSPAMRRLQRERLARFANLIIWQDIDDLSASPLAGIIFSNELVDAMPVHVVRSFGARLEEMYVTVEMVANPESEPERERLVAVWDTPSTSRIADYIERIGTGPLDGKPVEINLDAISWLKRISRVLNRGFLVTIDYGDIAAHLWGPDRPRGTLRSFHRHMLVEAPLERPGQQDITASVNFTALIEYGRDFGFEMVSFERQVQFLMRMGLIEEIAAMEARSGGAINDLKDRLAIKNLFVPGGVSDNFRVLIQRKK